MMEKNLKDTQKLLLETKKFEFALIKNDNGMYDVELPHQCQEWNVFYDKNLEDAIQIISEFIMEAQAIALNLENIRDENPFTEPQK